MCTTDDLDQYHQKFLSIAGPLVCKGKLSTDDRDEQFWAGFHPANQARLEDRLYTAHPNHDPTSPYGIQVIYEAARALFSHAQFSSQDHHWDTLVVDSDSEDDEIPVWHREPPFNHNVDDRHQTRRLLDGRKTWDFSPSSDR